MSGNRRKNSSSKAARAAQKAEANHLVSIPKDMQPELPVSLPADAEPVASAQEDMPAQNYVSHSVPAAPMMAEYAPTREAPRQVERYEEEEPQPVMEEPAPLPEPEEPKPAPKQAQRAQSASERIGDILRQARLDQNGDLYEIADYLRIKPGFLVALENSHYDRFPADAYVIGFLRTYANFLGIDGKMAVDRYRYEMAGRRKKPILSMPMPLSESRAPSGLIMFGVTVVLFLVYILWYGVSSNNRAEVTAAPPSLTSVLPAQPTQDTSANAAGLTAPVGSQATDAAATTTAPAAESSTTTTQAEPTGILLSGAVPQALPPPVPAKGSYEEDKSAKDKSAKEVKETKPSDKTENKQAQPAKEEPKKEESKKDEAKKDEPKKEEAEPAKVEAKPTYGDANAASQLTIRATQSSWVMVTDEKGKAVFDRVLKPGESYRVPDRKGLSLTTGNGAGLVLSVNGTDLPKVTSGAPHVVRNIPLDPEKLATQSPAQ